MKKMLVGLLNCWKRKTFTADILVAERVVHVTIEARNEQNALMEAEEMADGGVLLNLIGGVAS